MHNNTRRRLFDVPHPKHNAPEYLPTGTLENGIKSSTPPLARPNSWRPMPHHHIRDSCASGDAGASQWVMARCDVAQAVGCFGGRPISDAGHATAHTRCNLWMRMLGNSFDTHPPTSPHGSRGSANMYPLQTAGLRDTCPDTCCPGCCACARDPCSRTPVSARAANPSDARRNEAAYAMFALWVGRSMRTPPHACNPKRQAPPCRKMPSGLQTPPCDPPT